MKRLLTISVLTAVAVGVFLGACMAVSGKEVTISAEGIKVVAPENPQPESSMQNSGTTGFMLGKNVATYDAEQIVRILDAVEADARSAKAIFPGVYLPDHHEVWNNADTGEKFRMSVHMPYVSLGENNSCRNFTIVSAVDGVLDHLRGLACPESDGKWSFHNSTIQ
jgi:surface antigen